jgi:hypothetical protein
MPLVIAKSEFADVVLNISPSEGGMWVVIFTRKVYFLQCLWLESLAAVTLRAFGIRVVEAKVRRYLC